MSRDLILIGAGGHAVSCIDVIEAAGGWRIQGLVGRPEEVGTRVLGYEVLGGDEDLAALLHDCPHALVAVGQIRSGEPRRRLFELAAGHGAELPAIVSPRAHVSAHAELGAGTVVMHGAVVNAGARVGRNCIINSLALVEHGAEVADHCHISTHAALNSEVRVGAGTFVGSGATVRQGVSIGAGCVIGMGMRVLRDRPDGSWMPGRAGSRGGAVP
jgi:sugar O-acyltransferase (sialic acid O-acetyltransferase NeuD family)